MRLLIAGLIACSVVAGYGQRAADHRVSFRLIGKKEGFPYTACGSFLQGRDGVLWISTGTSLVRYDGEEFLPITHGPDHRPLRTTLAIESREGVIWAASTIGVVRVDPLSLRTEVFPLRHPRAMGTDGLSVMSVAWSHGGQLLCAAQSGLFHFDPRTGQYSELPTAGEEPVKPCAITMQPDDAWHGLYIETWNKGLMFYDTAAHKLFERDGDRSLAPWIGEDLVCMAPDGQGGYWASAHLKEQIWLLRAVDRSIRSWDHVPGGTAIDASGLMFLGRSSTGTVWGSGWKTGGFRFDPADSSALGFASLNDEYGTLPHDYLVSMYEAPTGETWFGNPFGIVVHDPAQPQVRVIDFTVGTERIDQDALVTDLLAEGDSVLWCMTYTAGLFRHDLRSGTSRRLALQDEGGGDVRVHDVCVVGERVFFATSRGLYGYDRAMRRAVPVAMRFADGTLATRRGIGWIVPDASGGMWMKSWRSFAHFDPRTGNTREWLADSLESNGLPDDAHYGGTCTPDGRFWICGEQSGLTYFDDARQSWVNLRDDLRDGRSPARRILDVASGPDGMLWLATDGNGLVRYDRRTRTYTQFDQRHGFTGLVIQTISFDRLGRLWLGTFEGVHCFDPRTERAVPMDVSSGMLFDEFSLGSSMASNGLFYIADRKRVLEFDPNTVQFGRPPPAPKVTRVLIDGEAVRVNDGVMNMPYGSQQLEVRFGAILPPGYIRSYAVRMNDGAWSESTDGKLSLRGLAPGAYLFELRLMDREGLWGPVTGLRVEMVPPWWQRLWARVLFALLLAGAIVTAFRLRLNWIRRRERKEEAMERTVNELKLQALRAQMDPHFIFNCLNSIDKYILMEQGEKASRYLNSFARLVRLILNQSESVSVPLEKEAEMLRYYLELEALRFKTPFAWEVKVDPDLLLAEAELPTMLVQPYAENAIWHGLQHKDGAGRITVEFRKLGNDLECVVEDDGIGREASARINAERRRAHHSMGMRVNADRLRLYAETHSSSVRTDIEDLRDIEGQPRGTRVRLVLPIESLEETNQPA